MEFIFATKNKGKLKEIELIMKDTNFTFVSMEQYGIDIDVVEDGETFEDNAILKAKAIMQISKMPTLSDDSGIEIDFLDKKPGVHSARYLGVDTDYAVKNNKILELLKDVPTEKRTARFISVIACVFPDNKIITTKGTIEGYISLEPKGENGFGYDPIFFVPEYNMTTSQLSIDIKNKISHRGKALELMKQKLIAEGIK